MSKYMQWTWSLALAVMTLVVVAAGVQAQTPEGTVITNTATATYTDANGNSYTPVTGSVSVTVGFQAGVTVTANTPSPTPASPSTGDTLNYSVANSGNGTDSVLISENISVAGVITVTGYRYSSTTYPSLPLLNAALAATAVTQGGSITIKVVYDVASNKGGVNTVYTLTAASRRTPATTDSKTSSITPAQTYAVSVTPHGGQSLQRLPGNAYSFSFTVQNNGNGSDNFDLLGSSPGSAVITIVSVNGVSGDSTRITLAAGASQSIAVLYNVATVAAGSTDTLDLNGRSVGQPATSDQGFLDLTVVKPNLTLTKAAYLDDGVTYVSTSSSTGWSVSVSGQNVTADYTGTSAVLAVSASATFELRVSIN